MSEYKCLCAHKCMLCESVLFSCLSMLCSVERIRGLTTKPKQEDIGAENYQHRKRKQAKMKPNSDLHRTDVAAGRYLGEMEGK